MTGPLAEVDFSEDYVTSTFCVDAKSCKKVKATVKSLKICFSSANEIVPANDIARLKQDFWNKHITKLQ